MPRELPAFLLPVVSASSLRVFSGSFSRNRPVSTNCMRATCPACRSHCLPGFPPAQHHPALLCWKRDDPKTSPGLGQGPGDLGALPDSCSLSLEAVALCAEVARSPPVWAGGPRGCIAGLLMLPVMRPALLAAWPRSPKACRVPRTGTGGDGSGAIRPLPLPGPGPRLCLAAGAGGGGSVLMHSWRESN